MSWILDRFAVHSQAAPPEREVLTDEALGSGKRCRRVTQHGTSQPRRDESIDTCRGPIEPTWQETTNGDAWSMPERGIRSTYSQCPFQLLVRDQSGIVQSSASAFFFETDGVWFIITNWHVVSGRNFLDGEPLATTFREPFSLIAKLSSHSVGDGKKGSFGIAPHEIRLYCGEHPVWFEHPNLGPSCDVVAIPLERPASCPDFMHNAANRISKDNIPVEPGCTVFVIGFPRAISVGFGLPLWKSGYVASEPHYDVQLAGKLQEYGGLVGGKNIPAFFIDSQTRAGMSGSPVFARYFGPWDMSDPYRKVDPDEPGFWERGDVAIWGSQGTMFIGCYSGRAGTDEQEAAVGLCWRTDTIQEICRAQKLGRNPHFKTG